MSNIIKKRDSNFELLRIIMMLLIIAHHYFVNSGLFEPVFQNQFSCKSLFYIIFGAWGKFAINCFVFITGYFMCKSEISIKKFFSLLIEIYFYKIVIFAIFAIFSLETLSVKSIVKTLIPFTEIKSDFISGFLVYFLFIPFLNILIKNLNKNLHLKLIILCFSIYSIFGSIPKFSITYNYVTWFCILHIIISFVSIYDDEIFKKQKLWIVIFLVSIFFAISSFVVLTWVGAKKDSFYAYQFVIDCNKIFAVVPAFALFLTFRNMKIKYNPIINFVASSTFGILLIHANSDTMRKWLWQDLLKNTQMYESKYFMIHAFVSVVGVFVLCLIIDKLRMCLFSFVKRFLENKCEIRS